jgi:hypothetical protein
VAAAKESPRSDLYDRDILRWSEQQSERLRRHAAATRENDQIDWPHVIEEIESVGSEQLHAVTSLLRQALIHMLKADAWPDSRDAATWRAGAIDFRTQAADRFTPSMRQRLDLARIYRQALRAVPATNNGQPPLPLPSTCPMTRDELLADS